MDKILFCRSLENTISAKGSSKLGVFTEKSKKIFRKMRLKMTDCGKIMKDLEDQTEELIGFQKTMIFQMSSTGNKLEGSDTII